MKKSNLELKELCLTLLLGVYLFVTICLRALLPLQPELWLTRGCVLKADSSVPRLY